MKKKYTSKIVLPVILFCCLAAIGVATVTQLNSSSLYINLTSGVTNNATYFSNEFVAGGENKTVTIYNTTTMCYQESANVSTNCGGVSTGTYNMSASVGTWVNSSALIDSNWSTYSYCVGMFGCTDAGMIVNYTKPSGSLNGSIWQLQHTNTTTIENYTLPTDCWNYSTSWVGVKVNASYSAFGYSLNTMYCYNGTWKLLDSHIGTDVGVGDFSPYRQIYEEAMYWNMTPYNFTAYVIVPRNFTNITHAFFNVSNTSAVSDSSNITLEVGTPDGNYEWNFTGIYDGQNITLDNTTPFNDALNNGSCNCTGCSFTTNYCMIPLLFQSNMSKQLLLSALNVTYDYNISYLFKQSDFKWDFYNDIVTNSTQNKTKWVNSTGNSSANGISIAGYYINSTSTSCRINGLDQTVAGNICQYAHNFNFTVCYQETANISTSCGGLNTGSYNSAESVVYDGDWNTGVSTPNLYHYFNYTKPSLSLNTSLWQIGFIRCSLPSNVLEEHNLSIPADCWNQSILQFRVRYRPDPPWDCYNGSDWNTLYASGSMGMCWGDPTEEAMWWNISNPGNYPDIEFQENSFGTGVPVNRTDNTSQMNTTTLWYNSTIIYLEANGSTPISGTFVNTTTLYCTNSSIQTNETLRFLDGVTWIDITPTTRGTQQTVVINATKSIYVTKDDYCYGDGIWDFNVTISQN